MSYRTVWRLILVDRYGPNEIYSDIFQVYSTVNSSTLYELLGKASEKLIAQLGGQLSQKPNVLMYEQLWVDENSKVINIPHIFKVLFEWKTKDGRVLINEIVL
jgi:hypothetical protein